ncbi:hypothetical protein GCM10010389_36080 [Streptomyces echinoruber]|uniref:MFS transporter n=1 Tax=Streptomyces echinoruber TaxID=68898 RepID=A0A918RDE7_9ACTN|nr:hypothetical protein GCM10010389_36080 [Streptomyces echinoruber]
MLMTLRQVGGALGIALLGSLLAGAFRDRLDVSGLPARAAETAGDSVVAAHLVAGQAGSARLAASADAAYVHGMGLVLLVCGVAALLAALPAAVFLPQAPPARTAAPDAPEPDVPAPGAPEPDAPDPGTPDPGTSDMAAPPTDARQ